MHASAEERKRWARDAREANRQAILEGHPGGHPEIDAKVLALTRITVARIAEDPSLVRTGLENIERWTQSKGGYLPRCHAEWKALIERHPWEELREMLLSSPDFSESEVRLRRVQELSDLAIRQQLVESKAQLQSMIDAGATKRDEIRVFRGNAPAEAVVFERR